MQPRAATVTAVSQSKCATMDRAAFLRLLGPMKDLLKVRAVPPCRVSR
jgi:CRP-like cAMP-binding protein